MGLRNQRAAMIIQVILAIFHIVYANRLQSNVINRHKCHCYSKEEILTADCAARNLTSIPSAIPDEVNVLLLGQNDIRRLSSSAIRRFRNLTSLDISHNYIVHIERDFFDGIDKLEILNMESCLILYTTFITPSLFTPLRSLRTLYMNRRSFFMEKYPISALQKLVSLETLFIDGLFGSPLEKEFEKLVKLKHISFSGHNGFCNISVLNDVTFTFLSHVEILNISKCNLDQIHPNTFKLLRNLTILDLSQNPCLYLKGVENATYGLQNSKKIRKLFFNEIVIPFATCVKVGNTLFKNMQNTSVQEVHFDKNRIETFNHTAFESFPRNLSVVSLKDNRLTYGSYLYKVVNLTGLQELDVSGEPYYPILPHVEYFGCLSGDFALNSGECSFDSVHNVEFLKYLMISESEAIPLPPDLTSLTVRYRQLPYIVHNLRIQKNSLKYLDLSYNVLISFKGNVLGLEGLEYIDISHNSVNNISHNFLKNFPVLKTLNMSANSLKYLLEKDTEGKIFKGLTKLIELNLSKNGLLELPLRVFDGLPSLRILNLSHNSLQEFNSNIIHMKDLQTLDCSHNDIRWIRLSIRKQLNQLAGNSRHNITLKLSHNPFVCTCENLDFLTWLKSSHFKLDDLHHFDCINSSGELMHFYSLKDILEPLQSQCHNHLSLYIGTTSATVLILALMILSVGYRYRWKMRYWYYAARLRYSTVQNNDSDDFEYDVFVSFADEDREFVVMKLLEKLENEAGLRLNIHQRDFTAGRPIAANIIEAVKNSRKTLFIFSEHFIHSYWCIYELQMATIESVSTGRDVILVLRLGDVPSKDIPTEILYHFQTDSYIDYPESEDPSLFWRTLSNSLKV